MPGVIERNIHPPVPLDNGLIQLPDVRFAGDIGPDEHAAEVSAAAALPAVLVDVDRDDHGSLGGQPPGAGQPDPAARPGDDGDPVLQALHLVTAHSSVEMKTFLMSVKDASASGPSSRPSPDCLNPPNGVQ